MSKNIQFAMEKFAIGEVKILVCTHIIESGIDIANANTMIVQFAELFGLAQLYQLRGRVGRSGRGGFAYLFYTDKSLLSRVAMVSSTATTFSFLLYPLFCPNNVYCI